MKLILAAIVTLAFCIGCGSSRTTVRGADWCDTDYEVSTFENGEAKSKTKLEDDTDLSLTEGDYELSSLDVYFNDTNRDIRTHVNVTIDEEGKATSDVRCVGSNSGQIKPDMEDYIFTENVISLLKVDASGKSLLGDAIIEVEYSYTGDDEPILKQPTYAVSDAAPSEKNLKDTFKSGYTKTDQFLFEFDDAYELQNKLEKPSLYIEIRQKWTKR